MKSSNREDLTKLSVKLSDIPRPGELKSLVAVNRKLLEKTTQKLAKFNPRELDKVVHSLHHDAFEVFDCLLCANCCRSISPAMSHNDVAQLSLKLKMRPSEIVTRHLQMDEDGDYVFTSAPCPFIDGENYCHVYSHRPKACSEYPHTNRARFYQLLKLSLKNAEICPVVYAILMKLS